MTLNRNDTELLSVRRRGSYHDALMSRAGLENWLEHIDFVPSSLPATAMLITKKLHIHSRTVGNSRASAYATEQAAESLNHLMDNCYHDAVTYARGLPPSINSDNIVFNDWAESIACLLCDIVRGQVTDHWWWRSFIKKYPLLSDASHTIANIVAQNLQYIAAIIEKLVQWQMLGRVFSSLKKTQAAQLGNALKGSYRFDIKGHTLFDALDTRVWKQNAGFYDLHANQYRSTQKLNRQARYYHDAENGDESWDVERYLSVLNDNARVLESLSLLEAKVSILTRSNAQQSLLRFWSSVARLPDSELSKMDGDSMNFVALAYVFATNPSKRSDLRFKDQLSIILHETFNSHFQAARHYLQACLVTRRHMRSSEAAAATTSAVEFIEPSAWRTSKATANQSRKPEGQGEQLENSSFYAGRSESVENQSAVDNRLSAACPDKKSQEQFIQDTVCTPVYGDVCQTHYGGVFYLINFFNYMDVPWCLEEGEDYPALPSAWALLELFAKYLLSFHPLDNPDRERLQLDDIWPLMAELDARKPGEEIAAKIDFAARLFPKWKAQLQTILGSSDEKEVYSLLHCLGSVHCTRTHIDFYASLNSISMLARTTGLDRDPGWCPQFCKVIKFYFE